MESNKNFLQELQASKLVANSNAATEIASGSGRLAMGSSVSGRKSTSGTKLNAGSGGGGSMKDFSTGLDKLISVTSAGSGLLRSRSPSGGPKSGSSGSRPCVELYPESMAKLNEVMSHSDSSGQVGEEEEADQDEGQLPSAVAGPHRPADHRIDLTSDAAISGPPLVNSILDRPLALTDVNRDSSPTESGGSQKSRRKSMNWFLIVALLLFHVLVRVVFYFALPSLQYHTAIESVWHSLFHSPSGIPEDEGGPLMSGAFGRASHGRAGDNADNPEGSLSSLTIPIGQDMHYELCRILNYNECIYGAHVIMRISAYQAKCANVTSKSGTSESGDGDHQDGEHHPVREGLTFRRHPREDPFEMIPQLCSQNDEIACMLRRLTAETADWVAVYEQATGSDLVTAATTSEATTASEKSSVDKKEDDNDDQMRFPNEYPGEEDDLNEIEDVISHKKAGRVKRDTTEAVSPRPAIKMSAPQDCVDTLRDRFAARTTNEIMFACVVIFIFHFLLVLAVELWSTSSQEEALEVLNLHEEALMGTSGSGAGREGASPGTGGGGGEQSTGRAIQSQTGSDGQVVRIVADDEDNDDWDSARSRPAAGQYYRRQAGGVRNGASETDEDIDPYLRSLLYPLFPLVELLFLNYKWAALMASSTATIMHVSFVALIFGLNVSYVSFLLFYSTQFIQI